MVSMWIFPMLKLTRTILEKVTDSITLIRYYDMNNAPTDGHGHFSLDELCKWVALSPDNCNRNLQIERFRSSFERYAEEDQFEIQSLAQHAERLYDGQKMLKERSVNESAEILLGDCPPSGNILRHQDSLIGCI